MARAKTEVATVANEAPEKKIEVMYNSILERVARLTDKKTGAIVVRNQQEADLAGEVYRDVCLRSGLRKTWRDEWYGTVIVDGKQKDREITAIDKVRDSLYERYKKFDAPMERFEVGTKGAANNWVRDEQARLNEATRKLNQQQQRKDPTFVAEAPKAAVTGFIPTTRWDGEVYHCEGKNCRCTLVGPGQFHDETVSKLHYNQGLRLFVQAAAKNEYYLAYLTEIPEALRRLATDKHDMDPPPGIRWKKIEGMRRE